MTIATELEVIHGSNALTELSVGRPPALVLEEAKKAAEALRDVISQKDKPVIFNGEQYIEYEDWQLVGRFYGVTVKVRETRLIHIGEGDSQIIGYEAAADVVLVSTGQIISAGEGMCLNDEERWSTRPKYEWQRNDETGKRERVLIGEDRVPLFQLRSMAQTRACAKALRNVLSWVVVLAGYRPTPAEEMTGDEPDTSRTTPPSSSRPRMPEPKRTTPTPVPPRQTTPPPAPKSGNGGNGSTDVVISDAQRKRFFAIWKGTGVPEDVVKSKLQEYGYSSSTQMKRSDYEELCEWASNFGHQTETSDTRSEYDDSV